MPGCRPAARSANQAAWKWNPGDKLRKLEELWRQRGDAGRFGEKVSAGGVSAGSELAREHKFEEVKGRIRVAEQDPRHR